MGEVSLLKDKNYAPKNLGEVCVLGLGKTGNVVTSSRSAETFSWSGANC